MKQLLSVFLISALLSFSTYSLADKPSWAGKERPPTAREIENHKEMMRHKNDDKKAHKKANKQHEKSHNKGHGKGRDNYGKKNDEPTINDVVTDTEDAIELIDRIKKWWPF